VGRLGLKEVLHAVRLAVHKEALRRTEGSARGTATLLNVNRAYIQRVFRRLGVPKASNSEAPRERRKLAGGVLPVDESA
jgi:hypothetical protein